MKRKITQIASDVATLLGESLALECAPEESPFPGIEQRVRLLVPAALAAVSSHPEDHRPFPVINETDDTLTIPDPLYVPLLLYLSKLMLS